MHIERVEAALRATHELLAAEGIWHCVTYGTLLGGIREGALIPWDHDFDLFVRPADLPRIRSLDTTAAGIELRRTTKAFGDLPLGGGSVGLFDAGRLAVWAEGVHLGDLFAPVLFADGVLRIFDLATSVSWTAHSSFPHFFVEELSLVSIAGHAYPAVHHPERFLAGVYGDDWRTPYKSTVDGGVLRSGSTTHGDTFAPKLAEEIAWCESAGWDRARYAGLPAWPRTVAGAGPWGATWRTASSSAALWYRDREELVANY